MGSPLSVIHLHNFSVLISPPGSPLGPSAVWRLQVSSLSRAHHGKCPSLSHHWWDCCFLNCNLLLCGPKLISSLLLVGDVTQPLGWPLEATVTLLEGGGHSNLPSLHPILTTLSRQCSNSQTLASWWELLAHGQLHHVRVLICLIKVDTLLFLQLQLYLRKEYGMWEARIYFPFYPERHWICSVGSKGINKLCEIWRSL